MTAQLSIPEVSIVQRSSQILRFCNQNDMPFEQFGKLLVSAPVVKKLVDVKSIDRSAHDETNPKIG